MMERERYEHYHVDLVAAGYVVWSSEPLLKSAARRLFWERVNELKQQVGKFVVRQATDSDRLGKGLLGAVKIAENHRIMVVLSKCDCDASQ